MGYAQRAQEGDRGTVCPATMTGVIGNFSGDHEQNSKGCDEGVADQD